MADCTPCESTYKISGCISKIFCSIKCGFIELKAYSKSIFKFPFFWTGCFLSNNGKHSTLRPIQRPFWCLHLLVDFRVLLDVIRRHGIRHILWTTGKSIAYCDRTMSSIGLLCAISFALKDYGRSSKRTFPPGITFSRSVKALRKISQVCPFDLAVKCFKTWGEMPSKSMEPVLENQVVEFSLKKSEVQFKECISTNLTMVTFRIRSGSEKTSL